MLALALSVTVLAQSTTPGAPTITSVKPVDGGVQISFTPGTASSSVSKYIADCTQAAGTVNQQEATGADVLLGALGLACSGMLGLCGLIGGGDAAERLAARLGGAPVRAMLPSGHPPESRLTSCSTSLPPFPVQSCWMSPPTTN